jgi:hypothetical protein
MILRNLIGILLSLISKPFPDKVCSDPWILFYAVIDAEIHTRTDILPQNRNGPSLCRFSSSVPVFQIIRDILPDFISLDSVERDSDELASRTRF